MGKISFDEAFKAMFNLQKVFEEVGKEYFAHIPGNTLRFLLMSEHMCEKFAEKTVKAVKDHIVLTHNMTDRKDIAHLDVKISKVFKTLSDLGFIELVPTAQDARIKEIKTTAKGQATIDEFDKLARKKWEEINNG